MVVLALAWTYVSFQVKKDRGIIPIVLIIVLIAALSPDSFNGRVIATISIAFSVMGMFWMLINEGGFFTSIVCPIVCAGAALTLLGYSYPLPVLTN
jgi:hypothetical protein